MIRFRLSFAVIAVALLTLSGCRLGRPQETPLPNPLAAGTYTITLTVDQKERFYILHVPQNITSPASLVVAIHGGTGNATIESEFYGWKEKADQEGFIVAFPNGASRLPGGQLATWDAGDCCGYANEINSNDVGFIRAMVEDIQKKATIRDVFATGMSNGGMLSYRLACDAADLFDAIAPVAGTDNTETCEPARPIPIFHIHSKQDNRVPYNGGCGDFCALGANYTSVPDTINTWVKQNGCNSSPTVTLNEENIRCETYTSCRNNATIKTCITEDGGHSWPGIDKNPNPLEGKGSSAIVATDEIWSFFQSVRTQ